MKYKVAQHPSEEGYAVSVPGLPGCWSQGATEEEALANISEAIHDYLGCRPDAGRIQGTALTGGFAEETA